MQNYQLAMRNRHQDGEIGLGRLHEVGSSARTLLHNTALPGKATIVMSGPFGYRTFGDGLSIHGGHVTEQIDLKSCFELPPGISINLVFEGHISFVFAGQRYKLQGGNSSLPTCGAIVASQPEMVTRHLKEGNTVNKLNLFAERHWLEKRFKTNTARQQLDKLFTTPARLCQWIPSQQIAGLALALLASERSIQHSWMQLHQESLAIELLAVCMEELIAHSKENLSTSITRTQPTEREKLKQQIDSHLNHGHSLAFLASELNMSASTLQRRFRKAFGITVIEYLRQRRLELARTAMIEEQLSIGQAAYLAGYKHSSNFITAFKNVLVSRPTTSDNGIASW